MLGSSEASSPLSFLELVRMGWFSVMIDGVPLDRTPSIKFTGNLTTGRLNQYIDTRFPFGPRMT